MAENENTSSENQSLMGRKIFFLHPSAFTQNEVIKELSQEEFEVYIIKDDVKLLKALSLYPNSIVYISINEGLKESAYEALLEKIQKNHGNSAVDIGIIASKSDEELKSKFKQKFKLNCGYTVVKSNITPVIKEISASLNKVNAKGRRKYIRLETAKETQAIVNIPIHGTFINGAIKDISEVGFSCTFKQDPELTKNRLFENIQIRLQSQLLKAEAIVFGSRMNGNEKTYVFLFSQRIDPDVKTKIRTYIQNTLQHRMELALK